MTIEQGIRKHELIAARLQNIKEFKRILNGRHPTYERCMSDNLFLNSVRKRLQIEIDLLNKLYNIKEEVTV